MYIKPVFVRQAGSDNMTVLWLAGCKALLAVLLSTPSGLAYIVQQHEACQSLIAALQTRYKPFCLPVPTVGFSEIATPLLLGPPLPHPSTTSWKYTASGYRIMLCTLVQHVAGMLGQLLNDCQFWTL